MKQKMEETTVVPTTPSVVPLTPQQELSRMAWSKVLHEMTVEEILKHDTLGPKFQSLLGEDKKKKNKNKDGKNKDGKRRKVDSSSEEEHSEDDEAAQNARDELGLN